MPVMTLFQTKFADFRFLPFYQFYPNCEAVSRVVLLLNVDPLAEVGVARQHSVGVEPLDNVDRAVDSSRQETPGYEEDQQLTNSV